MRLFRSDSIDVLNDEKCRKSLKRYFGILENSNKAQFLLSRMLDVNFNESDSDETLWRIHEEASNRFVKSLGDIEKRIDDSGNHEKSMFDLKILLANRIMRKCRFCYRACGANRLAGDKGYCKSGDKILVSTAFDHWGEEPELVPSGTIFTCGCTLTCLHCQNYSISQWIEDGTSQSPEELAGIIEKLHTNGCKNANLVGGDPTPWLSIWLEAFSFVTVNIPVVWNSNTYYSEETARLLAGFADIYLLDFKYGPGDCAERISNAPEYWNVCTSNHLAASKYGELIIRVLVLPGHLDCCTKPILEWISKNLGIDTRVNIMFQYRPEWRSDEIPELKRRLTANERKRVIELAIRAGLKNYIT